jgi:CubicO group peptidase (beta-lactamase class C family)
MRFGTRPAALATCVTLAFFLAADPAKGERRALPGDAELAAFLDVLVPTLLDAHHLPGAVVAVGRGDSLAFVRAYGWADVETRRPMSRDTLVRVASISKLVTATAALQLVEQGRLDLHADVNELLDFEIGSPFDEPISLHHLLTHTPGFDDRFLGTSVPHGATPSPLGDYLREHLPPVVMPPGRTLSYSNHGLALVGRLVELASGQGFDAYVKENVFDPLRMERSRFGVPHPVPADQALPYRWVGGRHELLWFEHLNDAPAGDLDTTAPDLMRFALAHLNGGALDGARILRPETVRTMHAQHFTHDPRLPGWAYGFREIELAGRRGIGHGGWVIGFHSRLALLPEERFAFFASVNGEPTGPFHDQLLRALSARLGGVPERPVRNPALDAARDAWVGAYFQKRRVRSSFLAVLQLATSVRMAANDRGGLTLSSLMSPTVHFVLAEPDFARSEDGARSAVLRRDPFSGDPQLVVGAIAYDRAPVLRRPLLHAALWIAAILLGGASLAGWGLGALSRRFLGGGPSSLSAGARWLGAVVAGLLAAIPVGLLAWVHDIFSTFRLWQGVPAGLAVVTWLPLLLGPAAFAALGVAILGLRRRPPLVRLHYGLLAIAGCALFLSLWIFQVRGPAPG